MMRFVVRLTGWVTLVWAAVVLLTLAAGSRIATDELLFSAGIGTKMSDLKLYRMDMQRQIMVSLTPEGRVDTGAVWSPDGTHIAFESRLTNHVLSDVYVMDAQGKQRRSLENTTFHELYPVWSNDGQLIAYMRTSDQRSYTLLLADVVSGETRQLIKNNDAFISPAWSPDGTHIAFIAKTATDSRENISTLDVNNGDIQLVIKTTSSHVRPVWTRDGSALTFVTTDYHYPQADIYTVNIANREAQPTVTDAAFPAWSPDGRYLLYTTSRTHVLAVYEAASGQTYILRRDSDGTFDYAGWSDDGEFVVYVSYRRSTNTAGIYRLNVAACLRTSNDCIPKQLTHEWGFYASPRWKPRRS